MKNFNKNSVIVTAAAILGFMLAGPMVTLAAGPAAVNLLSASNFVIISETGITNTGSHTTAITGNIGSSPIASTAMNNVFCSEITGTIYGVDALYVGSGVQTCFAGNPPLSNKTLVDNAVIDMTTAYTNAAGRTLPDGTELYAGNLGGKTITAGLYKWSTSVTIPTSVTLFGGANDVWIFQIAGDLSIASGGSVPAGIKVLLTGGAQASNVFWQVGGPTGATLGTYSTFNGTILSAKQVIIQTGAVLNGRAFAQSLVTLDANVIGVPTPVTSATLHVIKSVVNTHSGTSVPSNFTLYVKQSGANVVGSPAAGAAAPGTLYTLAAGAYTVSEDMSAYTRVFSGDCDSNGNVTLVNGVDKVCTVVNSDSAVNVPPTSSGGGGGSTHFGCTDPKASNYEGFAASNPALCVYSNTPPTAAPAVTNAPAVAPVPVATSVPVIPSLPNTGFAPENEDILLSLFSNVGALVSSLRF